MPVPRPRNAVAATSPPMPPRHLPSRDAGLWGMAAFALAAGGVAVATERGAFSFAATRPEPLQELTVGDDLASAMPVVTSLKSGGLPEREGVRVGDHVAAIDGSPVDTVAAIRSAVRRDRASVVGLEVVRGAAVWRAAALRLGAD